jgi:hypothetical protein
LNGGADRCRSRAAIGKILENWNVMSGELERLALSEDEVDAFIDCIEGYYRDVAGIKGEITRGRGTAAPSAKPAPPASASSTRPPVLPVRVDLWSKLGAG